MTRSAAKGMGCYDPIKSRSTTTVRIRMYECIYPEHPEEDAHLKQVAVTLGVPLERAGTAINARAPISSSNGIPS